jgi:DNA polymerase-3 subunit delta
MSSPPPTLFVFTGEDEPTLRDRLNAFMVEYSDPATADLNLTRVDGDSMQPGEIEAAAGALPFLADYRIVVVENLTASGQGRETIKRLEDTLPGLPDSTRLAFVETGIAESGSQAAARRKALRALVDAVEADPRGRILSFDLPDKNNRPRWIVERAERYGAEIELRAAHQLAERVGDDLMRADSELAKLATYANGRAITEADVDLLTPYTPEANIFNMVDALGQRRGGEALRLLRQLLDGGDEPLRVFGMIIRQYRLLLQMKEQLDRGQTARSAAKVMDVHPYVAQKLAPQTNFYSLDLLERIYHFLLETDLEIKTGQMDPELALEALVTRLAGKD